MYLPLARRLCLVSRAGEAMNLRVGKETATTITLGWDKVPDAAGGFKFESSTMPNPSFTRDPARTSVKFSKGAKWYRVEALGVFDSGEYRPGAPPPTSTAWSDLAWLQVRDPSAAFPSDFSAIYAELWQFGFRGIILGNVHHGSRIAPAYNPENYGPKHDRFIREARDRGWLVAFMGWLNEEGPGLQAQTAADVCRIAGVDIYIANAEDPFQASEYEDGGRSFEFLSALRNAGFTGEIGVNTYPGVDLDFRVWDTYISGAFIQTYNADRLRLWPADIATQWAIEQGISPSKVAPKLPCYGPLRSPPSTLIADCQRAGTLGLGLYSLDAALDVSPAWFSPFAGVIGGMDGSIARRGEAL